MRIVICGAGIGGLALAHALKDLADVVLVERETSAADTGGYRISLNDDACRALTEMLPPELLDDIRHASDWGARFEQFTIADSRLRPIIVAAEPVGEDRILAQRQVLRVLLARDLAPHIMFGRTVTAVSQDHSDARVTLEDGAMLEADLVIGADGAHSTVVRSLLGTSPTNDLGLTGIAGWAPASRDDPPEYLQRGPALAFGADGTGVFLSLYQSHAESSTGAPIEEKPGLIWGTIARISRIRDSSVADGESLHRQAQSRLLGWSPWLRHQVVRSDPARTAAFAFGAADPKGPIADWTASRITALGDAVHAMPPTGGRGASTAICDAADLAHAVREHLDGVPLGEALTDYQRRIAPRARAAIRESLGPVRIMNMLQHRPAQVVAAPLLRAAGTLGSWRYRGRR